MKKWPIYKAEEFCFKVTDGTHDSPKPQLEGRRLITSKHLKGNYIDFDSAKLISEADYQKVIARSKVDQWDILFSMIGTIGNIYLERNPIAEYACKNVGIFKFNGDKDKALWMYYWLKSPQVRDYVYAQLRGSTQAYLPLGGLREMPVAVPAIETQRKIAAILSALDDKIELNRRINENLCATIDAFYLSLFDSEIEDATIGDYAQKIYSGGTPNTSNLSFWNGNLGWFSSGETRNRFVINTEKTITQAGVDNSSTKLARKYDIVIASAGQGFTRGQTSMLLLDTYVNQSVIVIHTDRRMSPYLFWSLGKRYNELRAVSDSNSIRGSLTTKMIAAFKIPKGNDKRLEKFSNYTWPIIAKIENNLCENNKLIAMRDALLPRLMSGEIDVSDVSL
ncbi:MAG: restriction endonuclease subunit S [Thermoguttaceae bacterium]|nr:restriction endonuclease subunit S [Thermoguttaceae bacterium]